MSTPARRIVASTLRIERAPIEWLTAARCTVGVAVPLLLGLAIGQPTVGVFGAVGALSVGFGSFQGLYRSRAATMLVAAAGMAMSIFVGSVAGLWAPSAVATAALWAFASGYVVALGPAATFVGTQSSVAVIVAAGFPVTAADAGLRSLLVLAGGLLQILLLVAIWPLRGYAAERRVVSTVYGSLAGYAGGIPGGQEAPPEPHTLGEAPSAIADPQPLARTSDLLVFHALLDEAERIRASLAALALRRGVLDQRGDDAGVPAANQLASLLSALLRELADAVAEGREPEEPAGHWGAIEEAAREIAGRRATVAALLGQVRAAWRTASVPSHAVGEETGPERLRTIRPLRRRPLVQDSLSTLRANLTLRSTALRHALRSGFTVGIAMAVYEVTGLERGYWIGLTALLVLRPEFHETFSRGLARVGGTLAGAGAATLIMWMLNPGPPVIVLLILGFVFAGYLTVRANYALFTVCITGYVVFLLVLAQVPEPAAALYRVLSTIAGGALAFAMYAVWPSWEGRQARELIADLVDAHAAYVVALLEAYAGLAPRDLGRLNAMRAHARLLRSNAEGSVDRLQNEPASPQAIRPDVAVRLLAALRRHALAALALHADLDRGAGRPLPDMRALSSEMEAALRELAESIRHGTPLGVSPPLRELQQSIVAPGGGSIADETDLMVDSLNTMGDIVRAG